MPLALIARERNRRVVFATNEVGAAQGLRRFMTATQAQTLVAGLAIFDADPDEDAAALDRLARWALQHYAPIVAADPPDGLVIDARGAAHLHGGERAMLNDMIARLAKAGIAGRVAMAGSWGAAHALARHHPAPILTLAPAEGRSAVAGLPVAALRLEPGVVQSLSVLGLNRIADLLAIKRAPLLLRFGEALGRRLDQALGHVAEPITPVEVEETVSVSRPFAEPISAPETLIRYTGLLAATLCKALETRSLGARKVDLLFHRVDNHIEAIRIGTAKPSREPKHLTRLLCGRLEFIDPGFGIERMTLTAPWAEAPDYRAAPNRLGEARPADMATLIDSLTARIGTDRLYRKAPVESDIPERAVRKIAPLADPVPSTWPLDWPRPSRLFASPEPITTVALLPDHPPAQFTWRGTRHRVVRADGPERVFAEWIGSDAGTNAARDYFIVEDEAGLRFWIFRAGAGDDGGAAQNWFLHGLFA